MTPLGVENRDEMTLTNSYELTLTINEKKEKKSNKTINVYQEFIYIYIKNITKAS